MELTEEMEKAGFDALNEYAVMKARGVFPRPSLIAHLWGRMVGSSPQQGTTAPLLEQLDMAIALIQEAKGADGPKGGFVTDHLDAAEGWLDKVVAALTTDGEKFSQDFEDHDCGEDTCVCRGEPS